MRPIDVDGFEALFRTDTDPWNYAASTFEAFKRRELLRACGTRQYGRGLELACANGETSRHLIRRCLSLLAVDASPTVIAAAQERVQAPGLTFAVARLPEETPRGPFDLIVASEILYYLPRADMAALLDQLMSSIVTGGRIVLVHHIVPFDDAAQPPSLAQSNARAHLVSRLAPVWSRRHRRFDVAAYEKTRSR